MTPTRIHRAQHAAAALLLALAACAAPELPVPDVSRHEVTLLSMHDGSRVEIGRDQTLVVRLVMPTTNDYAWSLVEFAPGVLAAPGPSKFERQPRGTNINDAAGDEVWRFTPAAAGSATLKFEYRHLRALDPAPKTVSFVVTVR